MREPCPWIWLLPTFQTSRAFTSSKMTKGASSTSAKLPVSANAFALILPAIDRHMIPELVARADDIECIVTQTPQAALILERQLIREHMPRFNSMLKDGKSFPYLAMTNEEYPRIMYTRRPPKSAQQWGPFPNAGAAKQVMQALRRQFGIRDCKELLPQGGACPCTSAFAPAHASTAKATMSA